MTGAAPAVVDGVVKRAYPLRKISAADRENHAQEADVTRYDLFTLGCGPCCHEAAQVMTLEMETHDRSTSGAVYFYDEWASKVSTFQRHVRVLVCAVVPHMTVFKWLAVLVVQARHRRLWTVGA